MVACPQKSTSWVGVKYRTRAMVPSRRVMNTVSGAPSSSASACMSCRERCVASSTTPARLPCPGVSVKALTSL